MRRLRRFLALFSGFDPELEDVVACHDKFGILVSEEPSHLVRQRLRERVAFLREEVTELEDAAEVQDMDEMLDALLDIVYVAKGTAAMLGLRRAWRLGWSAVHRANMAKERGVGKRGHKVDLVKPRGWLPPDHRLVLSLAGYDRRGWQKRILEGRLVDDGGAQP